MRRILIILALLSVLALAPTSAQDALELATELYVLLNDGYVERYGLGAAGVQRVSPDGAFVVDFAIAPDNIWLAYRTQDGLWLADMYTPDSAQMLEGATADAPPIRGRGETIAWSPQGDAIAYTTLYGLRLYSADGAFHDVVVTPLLHLQWSPQGRYLAAEAEQNIWWIYRRDGAQLTLVAALPFSVGMDWLNDSQLVFAPQEGGLVVLDLANGNAQTPLLDASWVCGLPFMESPESILFFARRNFDPLTAENSGRLIRVNPATRATEDLGTEAIEFGNIRWARGGNFLVASQAGVLALIEPRSAQGFTLPIASAAAYGWGPLLSPRQQTLATPRAVYFLADDINGTAQAWVMRPNTLPETLTPAETAVTVYAVARGGRRIAYVSDGRLWVHQSGADQPQALLDIAHEITHIAFSPDGGRIAYVTRTTPDDPIGGVWLLSADGGEPEQLLQNGPQGASPSYGPPFYGTVAFAPNINALLVATFGGETTDFIVLDLNTRETIPVGRYDGAFWLSDGRVAAHGTGIGIGDPQPSDVFIIDVNTQTELVPLFTVPADQRIINIAEIGPNTLGLITAPNRAGPKSYSVLRLPSGGQAERIATLRAIHAPQFAPDGSAIIGYSHPRGQIVLYDIDGAQQTILRDPLSVWDLRWD